MKVEEVEAERQSDKSYKLKGNTVKKYELKGKARRMKCTKRTGGTD